jgi:hypothetical protein
MAEAGKVQVEMQVRGLQCSAGGDGSGATFHLVRLSFYRGRAVHVECS